MKIRFINHASFIMECAGRTILCDPWTIGKAFNKGWALLSPSAPVDYSKIDYLWVSHQHPDHFNFPTLKSIPSEDRLRMTVLYQRHASPKIVNVFKKMGFANVRELPLHRWIRLQPDIELFCGSVGSMDSFLGVRSEGEMVLNLNDCFMSHAHTRHIRRLVGRPSILFSQFSFGGRIGNYADDTHAAENKIEDLKFRVELFQPEFTIPFASFIYFCNEENSWTNKFIVTPERVMRLNLPGVNFMYPGDEWNAQERSFRSQEAVERYMRDLQHITIDPTPESVDAEKVQHAVERSLQSLHGRLGRFIASRIEPFDIYLPDLDKVLSVNSRERTCTLSDATPRTREHARYAMCSQAAWYAFQFAWGWGALQVSGMYLDREHTQEQSKFAFYQNILGSEYLDFHSLGSTLRTLVFLWKKRFELFSRFFSRANCTSSIAPAARAASQS